LANTEVAAKNFEMDKKMFWKTWWGCALMGLCFSMVKMMTTGTCCAMIPYLRKLYPEQEKLTEALVRHQPFFNCTPETAYFIVGLVLSMEKEYATDPEHFDPAPISAIKAALMGPLSGVGDAIFWVAVRTIATSLSVGLMLSGNVIGFFVFPIVYHGLSVPTRIFLLRYGFNLGSSFITTAYESGIIDMLTMAATTIGLLMVGAMAAGFVNLSTTIVLVGSGATATTLQSALDSIFPKLLPLIVTLVTLWAIRKRINASWIIIAMLVLGIGGALLGIV